MPFPQRPRFLGLAVILGVVSALLHSRPVGLVVAIAAVIVGIVAIVQEYQRLKRS